MSTLDDILSTSGTFCTLGDVQYIGVFKGFYQLAAPMTSPDVFMISPDVLMVSPNVLNITRCTHDIPPHAS